MRYSIAEIEDQIIATLTLALKEEDGDILRTEGGAMLEVEHDSDTFEVSTHAGDISAGMFMIPQLMEGLVRRLPFVLVQYQGRTSGPSDKDSIASIYTHTLTFRLYVGAKSLRTGKEAARGAYDILAIIYDKLHGRTPLMAANQVNPGLPKLEGTAISRTGFNPLSPLMETGGTDERLVVNLPEIKVYSTDFRLKVIA